LVFTESHFFCNIEFHLSCQENTEDMTEKRTCKFTWEKSTK